MGPEVDVHFKRGADLLRDGRLLDAQREFYKAVDASGKDTAVKLRVADTWRTAGWRALMGRDDPENGWTMFHNARALYRSVRGCDGGRLSQAARGMAIAAGKMGDHEDALRACDEAEFHAPGPEERAKAWNTRAISLSILGRDAEATQWAGRVLESSANPDTVAVARQSLGILLIKHGSPKRALAYLEDDVLRAWAHQEAGEFKEALRLAPKHRPRGCTVRARALIGLGRHAHAMVELRRGAKLIEEGRAKLDTEGARASFQGSKQDVHSLLVGLCCERKRWEEAFLHAESARARSFLDFVAAGGQRDLSHLRPSERSRFEGLRSAIDAERDKSRREALEAEYTRSLRRYEKERLASRRIQPRKPLTASQVCRSLAPGVTLLQYQVTDEAVYAFVLARGKFRALRLRATAEEILEAARDLSRTLAVMRRDERSGRRSFFDWHFGELGRMLLGDLPLEGVDRLVVVPQGALHLVPFSALRVKGRYLMERCTVSLSPSASVHVTLAAKARGAPSPERCLLIKDPTGTLKHADAEEEALRARFGEGLTVLSGGAATRAAVMAAAPGHPVLHFATHAVYRQDRPEFSHLELACGEKLWASDILGLDLAGTRLVTLSACDSGRGDFSSADEMIGLPRAFLRAGARSVLATLWPLEDHSGIASLVMSFYEHFSTAGGASSLRQAQSDTLGKGIPSSLWSAFSMIGT